MSKKHKRQTHGATVGRVGAGKAGLLVFLVAVVAAAALLAVRQWPADKSAVAPSPSNTPVPTNQVAQSVMVTVELDFGGRPPSISDALKEIERRSAPEDGVGRTFAILDAPQGETNVEGKLKVSMHVSMEKPGLGALVFRRTGAILWQSKIIAAPTGPPPPKQLTILMADAAGKSVMLDGSKGASHVLNTPLNNSPSLVRDLWPDGAEHEFTFLYSVCGCPVKVRVRRNGETTARTSELPVMFPDDPDALRVIHQLMGWPAVP